MRRFLAITRALADETRVRALLALEGGELCLCQLIELLGLAPSTVSRHMAVLQRAGLVERRKEGKWHFYRQGSGPDGLDLGPLLGWVRDSVADDSVIRGDADRLATVRATELVELAACYRS
jgi:ArsR family transcriptional regulator